MTIKGSEKNLKYISRILDYILDQIMFHIWENHDLWVLNHPFPLCFMAKSPELRMFLIMAPTDGSSSHANILSRLDKSLVIYIYLDTYTYILYIYKYEAHKHPNKSSYIEVD
jgi:hypothetical protein